MRELIEALRIFIRYKNIPYPTDCKGGVLRIVGVLAAELHANDVAQLRTLGFLIDARTGEFISYQFGSARL